jgi:hypothetical protein
MSEIRLDNLKRMVKAISPIIGKVGSVFMPVCSSTRVLADVADGLDVERSAASAQFIYPESVGKAHGFGPCHYREDGEPWPEKPEVIVVTKHANGLPNADPIISQAIGWINGSTHALAVLVPTVDPQRFIWSNVLALRPDVYPLIGTEFCWLVYTIGSRYPQSPGKWRLLEW